jgi:hypothetical protein
MLLAPLIWDAAPGRTLAAQCEACFLVRSLPAWLLWLAIAGIGLLLTGPLKVWDRTESALNWSL